MKKILTGVIVLVIVLGAVWGVGQWWMRQSGSMNTGLTFTADSGMRMEQASNPGVKWSADGSVQLLYRDESGMAYVATSEDGLRFGKGKKVTQEGADLFRAKQLPDGSWIGFDYDLVKGDTCLKNHRSDDGVNFDFGTSCVYAFAPEDNGLVGVYDFFADQSENIVLLYTGDRQWPGNEDGLNNLRRAYSEDNGETFTFTHNDILNDAQFGGGENSFVDPNLVVLDDGTVFLVAMKQGDVHGFISTDDGVSFEQLSEPVLEASDFSSLGNAIGMTDPQVLLLPNGDLRVYAHLIIDEGRSGPSDDDQEGIVSGTANL